MAKTSKKEIYLDSSTVRSFPQPPPRKSEDYLKAYTGYAYSAISAITQEVASVELNLYNVDFTTKDRRTTPIYMHQAISLLHYVNPLFTFYDLVEATEIYLELTGEAYWVVFRDEDTGEPYEIWPLRPDWIRVVPGKELISHYIYSPGGNVNEKIELPKENVIPFKYFDPLNPYRGKGSIQAAALPLDIHTFAQEWNRNFFFNSAIPNLIFTTEKRIDKRSIERFMNSWQESYGGRNKSNKAAFLGGGFKVDTATMKAKELDFTEQQKMMRDDVLAVFRVPKTILGLTDDVNRANAEATTRAFMQRVITPRMKKFTENLNEFLLPMYKDAEKLFFDFTDPAPEDEEMRLKKYDSGLRLGWLTQNEVRAEEGLDPIAGGDVLISQGSKPTALGTEEDKKGIFKKKIEAKKIKRVVKPVKHMVNVPVKRLEEFAKDRLKTELRKDLTKLIGKMMSKKNGDGEKQKEIREKSKLPSQMTKEEKDEFWKRFIDFVTDNEEEIVDVVKDIFKEQESDVLNRLEDVKYWKKDLRKGKESSLLPKLSEMATGWRAMFIPLIRHILITQGAYTLSYLSTPGELNLFTDTSQAFLLMSGGVLIDSINETTRDSLKVTLAEGFGKEETTSQLRDRVSEVFTTATKSRAQMIARTEAIRASNFATLEAYRQSGVVVAKQWLTERDGSVCAFCESMDGTVMPLDGVFAEAGSEMNEGGNTLTIGITDVEYPSLHPNCRCTLIPILEGEDKALKAVKKAKNSMSKMELASKEMVMSLLCHAQNKAEGIIKEAEGKGEEAMAEAKEKAEALLKEVEIKGIRAIKEMKGEVKEKKEKDESESKVIAKEIVDGAEAEKEAIEKDAEEIKEKAEVKAKKKIKKAETEAVSIVEEAKETKNKLLGQLRTLREKMREALNGQPKKVKKA